jgi:hypothetical protein
MVFSQRLDRRRFYRRSNYYKGKVGIPLTSLTMPQFCACSKPGHGFPMPYVVIFLFSQCFEVVRSDCWSTTKQTSSYQWNVALHDIVEQSSLGVKQQSLTHSLIYNTYKLHVCFFRIIFVFSTIRPTSLVESFIVLTHWNNSLWVDMSLRQDTFSWFRAKIDKNSKYKVYSLYIWPEHGSNRGFTGGEHAN